MKRYTFSELQDIADERGLSKENDKLYATSDGQFFVNKNYANLHKRQGKDLKIFELVSVEVEEGVDADKLDWKQRVELVSQLETVEDVEAFLEGETAKSVREAGAKRIEELNNNSE